MPLHRVPGLVQRLRAVKDADEVEALRRACAVGDAALADLLEAGGLRPGRTEREVALELEDRMRRHGAAGPAFETILAAGRTRRCHTTGRRLPSCGGATW